MRNRLMLIPGMVLLFAACGGSYESAVGSGSMGQNQAALKAGIYDAPSAEAPRPATEAGAQGADRTPSPTSVPRRARMIIRTGQISIEVDDFAAALSRVQAQVSASGGFVSGSTESTDEKNRRYGSITCRIPSDKWDSVVTSIRAVGKVLSQGSHGEDVTQEFYDIDARLLAQQKLEAELLALMESARKGGLSDLLEIEREVARVRGEIESMQGRKRFLSEQAALSTLTVELREPMALIDVEPGAFDPLWRAVSQSARVFSESVGALVTLGAGGLPWLVAVVILWKLVRRSRKKASERPVA
jgi:hypothetical protein